MSVNSKTKNVKLPVELVDSVYKRKPDTPAGATLMEIYTEYEKLEELAKGLVPDADLSKNSVFDVFATFFSNGKEREYARQKAIDDLKIMLEGLEKFFTLTEKR